MQASALMLINYLESTSSLYTVKGDGHCRFYGSTSTRCKLEMFEKYLFKILIYAT